MINYFIKCSKKMLLAVSQSSNCFQLVSFVKPTVRNQNLLVYCHMRQRKEANPRIKSLDVLTEHCG